MATLTVTHSSINRKDVMSNKFFQVMRTKNQQAKNSFINQLTLYRKDSHLQKNWPLHRYLIAGAAHAGAAVNQLVTSPSGTSIVICPMLELATLKADTALVKVLFESGAEANSRSSDADKFPLSYNAVTNVEILNQFIMYGAQINRLLLCKALTLQESPPQATELLLCNGANPNQLDDMNNTPLHTMIKTYWKPIDPQIILARAQSLICHGARIDIVDQEFKTPEEAIYIRPDLLEFKDHEKLYVEKPLKEYLADIHTRFFRFAQQAKSPLYLHYGLPADIITIISRYYYNRE